MKSKVHEDCRKIDQLIQVIKHSEYYLSSCFPRMFFPRGSVLSEAVRAEFHSAIAAAPKRQPESLLESVGIPGCMCREPGMPCVCTRLMALGKEAIFIPKHAVVQVKSTEITIAVVFRSLALSFLLQRFSCTLFLTWASSALLGHSAQGRGVCCRNGWSFSLCHISQAPSFTRASSWQTSCWPEVEGSSAALEGGRSSGSLIPSGPSQCLPLTRFKVLDPSAASALACGAASGVWGRVSRLDQSIVSGLHVIWKCQPYLSQARIKGFAIAIC